MCRGHCGRNDTTPVGKDAVSIRCYGMDGAAYLDGPYPGQALLSSFRAHPVLDLGQDIRDSQKG